MPHRFTRTGGVHRLDVAYVAAGDLDRSNFQHLLVDPEVDLAPDPPLGPTMLARSSGKQSPGLFSDPPHSIRLRLPP